jgi:hypothetical protein
MLLVIFVVFLETMHFFSSSNYFLLPDEQANQNGTLDFQSLSLNFSKNNENLKWLLTPIFLSRVLVPQY